MSKIVYISVPESDIEKKVELLEIFTRELFEDCIILNPAKVMPRGIVQVKYMSVRTELLKLSDVVVMHHSFEHSRLCVAERYLARAYGVEVITMSERYEKTLEARLAATVDSDGQLVFVCPRCSHTKLEGVLTDVTLSIPVKEIDCGSGEPINTEITWDTDNQVETGGVIDRFQCSNCGYVIKDATGDVVDNYDDLAVCLKEGVK